MKKAKIENNDIKCPHCNRKNGELKYFDNCSKVQVELKCHRCSELFEVSLDRVSLQNK